jgi:hypothetical protein
MAQSRGRAYNMSTVFLLPSILRWRRSAPRWRSLCDIESAGEAALVSARCRYSLDTLEVMCNRAATFCALVEQEHPDTWRWAVHDVNDFARREGTAPTKAAAKCAAFKALVALDQEGVIALSPDTSAPHLALSLDADPVGETIKKAVPRILPWRTEAEH